MEFKTIKLGDLYDVASGLSKSAKEFGNGGYPFLSFKTIFYNYFLPDELPDLANTTEKEQEKCSILEGDVFLTRTSETADELGMSSVALKDYPSGTFNGFSKRLRMKQNCGYEVYPKYMGYFLRSTKFRNQLNSMSIASTRASLNIEMINRLTVDLPDIKCQKKIADFLFLIDEKIKNNEAINRNLYKQAESMCKAWFNDYEPFGGECPSEWEITPLSDIAEFVSGYSYKGKELSDSSKIAMATIKNFDRSGGFKLNGYKPIEPSPKLKETQHAELFDTLVAHTDLTQNADIIGNAELVLSKNGYEEIIFSMDVVKVMPKGNVVSSFLIAALLRSYRFKQHCLGYINGTTVLHLSKKALPNFELPLPSDFKVLKPLDTLLESIYKQIALKIEENIKLESLRDYILPKLMSGELDVSDLDI